MSQFTNNWNGQNGMMGQDQIQPMGMPGNMPMQPVRGQISMQPNVAGWKAYSPPPQPQIKPTNGRWVESYEDIMPREVPMDGSICFFPQEDCSCIYAKFWDNNGNLQSFRFLPEKNEPPVQQQTIPAEMNDILKGYTSITENILNRLDSLDGQTKDILAAVQTKTTRAKASNTNDREDK